MQYARAHIKEAVRSQIAGWEKTGDNSPRRELLADAFEHLRWGLGVWGWDKTIQNMRAAQHVYQPGEAEPLRFGCTLEIDSDGDWVIVPPEDVTIFSVPGEGVLIGRCTRENAEAEAREYLAGIVVEG